MGLRTEEGATPKSLNHEFPVSTSCMEDFLSDASGTTIEPS